MVKERKLTLEELIQTDLVDDYMEIVITKQGKNITADILSKGNWYENSILPYMTCSINVFSWNKRGALIVCID